MTTRPRKKTPVKRTAAAKAPEAVPPLAGVGGYVLAPHDIAFNADRPSITLEVRNTGDRPIQVGSHFHFFEVNRALAFDRERAFGMHLNVPSSTAIRFEPGDQRTVSLVPYGGKRRAHGFNNLVDGETHAEAPGRNEALRRVRERGFKSV